MSGSLKIQRRLIVEDIHNTNTVKIHMRTQLVQSDKQKFNGLFNFPENFESFRFNYSEQQPVVVEDLRYHN